MSDISMAVDLDMCTGCFACQSACKMVNELPSGVNWLKVSPPYCQPDEFKGELYMDRFPVPLTLKACKECGDYLKDGQPLCVTVCMGRALFVGPSDIASSWAKGKRTVVYNLPA